MADRYTIVRAKRRRSSRDPFTGGFSAEALNATREPPETEVHDEQLSLDEVRDLAADSGVVGLAPVMPTRLIEPIDPGPEASASGAWGIAAVKASTSPFDGAGVKLAILDTGIDANHPAFAGLKLIQADFSGQGNGDRHGHGTHCAGIAVGGDVAGQRIGVARGVDAVLIGKVLGATGRGDTSGLVRGLQWASESDAQVVSMSLGFDFPGMVEDLQKIGMPPAAAASRGLEVYRANLRLFERWMALLAARAAVHGGAVVVAAAGNENRPGYGIGASFPAAAEGVIAVGALDHSAAGYVAAPFSNLYPQVSAPGVRVLSAQAGGGIVELSGTSMAAPHVAGVAALWWQSVRTANQPPTASFVSARVVAWARADVFSRESAVASRGAGLVTAPQV